MRHPSIVPLLLLVCFLCSGPAAGADASDVWDRVDHRFVESAGVKIHYVALGTGKPVLFIHGFPDFWYSWRHQMAALQPEFKAAAMDLRGYNQSDQPAGVESYRLPLILADVAAVVADLGGKVTLVGHDWGGAIAWRFAMQHPEQVERLVILNLTHPRGYAAVVANPTEAQRANTEYARRFASSQPDGSPVPDRILAMGDRFGEEVGRRYREAFGRSSYDGMLNYYRANYGQVAADSAAPAEIPDLEMPVLQFHGLKDTAVDKDGLKNTWDWIDADYTLVTIPESGHWVQHDAGELVSQTMRAWLLERDGR
jgi:pimeloyl-ACP methyl ester carboxylesterase